MIEFKNLEKALKDYADAIRDQYKDNLERDNRRATGNLITSINSKIEVNGNEFEIQLQLADYWYYVENGRGAGGFPPINKILEWIRVKPILPHPDSRGKLPTEKQLAFLIGRKIANEGYEGSNDLGDALNEVDYDTIIEEALDKDVLGCIDEILQFKL